jgi:hypothetical protein
MSPGASNKMAAPETNYTPKKSQLFIQFSLICLNNLKLLSAENRVFYFKYLLCCPLDSAARGDRTTNPTLATTLSAGDIRIAIKTTRTRHNVTSYVHCRSCDFPRQRDGWKDDVCMDYIRVATVSSTGLRHDWINYFPSSTSQCCNPACVPNLHNWSLHPLLGLTTSLCPWDLLSVLIAVVYKQVEYLHAVCSSIYITYFALCYA